MLFVGTHSLRKGIGDLFDAVRPLVGRGQCELWLVGNPAPDARRVLHRNADIFIEKGPQPRTSLAWYYSQGSILVLPSLEEGLAFVLPQAMAWGLPVIASTNTGAEDLIEDGVEGFIVPIRDPAMIRSRIEWMIDNPRRREEMGVAARQRVNGFRGWEAFARASREVYLKAMSPTAAR